MLFYSGLGCVALNLASAVDGRAAGALSCRPHCTAMVAGGAGGSCIPPSKGWMTSGPTVPWEPRVTGPRKDGIILGHNLSALKICILRRFPS